MLTATIAGTIAGAGTGAITTANTITDTSKNPKSHWSDDSASFAVTGFTLTNRG
jgi:hypothetical protein